MVPTVVHHDERVEAPGPRTPGMDREQAFADDDRWIGYVRTEAGVKSGWHHHGEMDTYIYVVAGTIELESGPGGRELVSVGVGDFAHVPGGTVHREGTPVDEPGEAVIVRIGSGQPIFNVEDPE